LGTGSKQVSNTADTPNPPGFLIKENVISLGFIVFEERSTREVSNKRYFFYSGL